MGRRSFNKRSNVLNFCHPQPRGSAAPRTATSAPPLPPSATPPPSHSSRQVPTLRTICSQKLVQENTEDDLLDLLLGDHLFPETLRVRVARFVQGLPPLRNQEDVQRWLASRSYLLDELVSFLDTSSAGTSDATNLTPRYLRLLHNVVTQLGDNVGKASWWLTEKEKSDDLEWDRFEDSWCHAVDYRVGTRFQYHKSWGGGQGKRCGV